MRPIAKLLFVAGALGLGAACTNSGLGGQISNDSGPTLVGPGGTGTGTGGGGNDNCEWTGTWAVNKAWCGTFEIDGDWFAVYPDTEMVITDTGNGDGSCNVAFSWSSASCAEEEDWTITSTSAQSWSIVFEGIATCAPDACTFFGSDDTCVIGDRVNASPLDFDIEVLQPTQIRLTGLFGDETVWVDSGYPQCTLDLTTEWTKQ